MNVSVKKYKLTLDDGTTITYEKEIAYGMIQLVTLGVNHNYKFTEAGQGAVSGLESLLCSMSMQGIKLNTPNIKEAINTTWEYIVDDYSVR